MKARQKESLAHRISRSTLDLNNILYCNCTRPMPMSNRAVDPRIHIQNEVIYCQICNCIVRLEEAETDTTTDVGDK